MSDDFLFDITELVQPDYEPRQSHRERFEAFHASNPWVATAFERLIQAWLRSGHQRVGMKAVAERIRWEYGATTGDVFKLNNNHVSYYAELMLERHPEWSSAIYTRGERAA
jgi:hypothetical protein